MKIELLLAIVTIGVKAQTSSDLKFEGRIIGGKDAKDADFPHQALIYIPKQNGSISECGGALISSTFVLSAAHCFVNHVSVRILFGSADRKDASMIERFAADIFMHPNYAYSIIANDIALVRLKEAVNFTLNLKAIRLPNLSQVSEDFEDEILAVSGFGWTLRDRTAELLQYTALKGVDCEDFDPRIDDNLLCAVGYPNRHYNPCYADSGGPLIYFDKGGPTLIGIVAGNIHHPKLKTPMSKCIYGEPELFTRVAFYLKWIYKVTGIKPRKVKEIDDFESNFIDFMESIF